MATIESGTRFGIPMVFLVSIGLSRHVCLLFSFADGQPQNKAEVRSWQLFISQMEHFTFMWRSVSKSVVFLYHLFAGFRLISCAVEKVEAPVMSSSLNKRTAPRPCSSWGKARSMMRW